MCFYSVKLYCIFTALLCMPFLFPSEGICQNFAVNGELQKEGKEGNRKDSIIRKESLIIKDKRVYIKTVIDQGAKHLTDHDRYKEMLYLLPKEIVFDDMSNRIYYYTEGTEIEVGQLKHFLGFMPYIGLSEG